MAIFKFVYILVLLTLLTCTKLLLVKLTHMNGLASIMCSPTYTFIPHHCTNQADFAYNWSQCSCFISIVPLQVELHILYNTIILYFLKVQKAVPLFNFTSCMHYHYLRNYAIVNLYRGLFVINSLYIN